MKQALTLLAATLLLTAGVGASIALASEGNGGGPPTEPPGQGECEHGNSGQECKPDPQPEHGQDCDEHGNQGGVNEDHCLPETTTTPTTTTPTTPTDTTPTTTTTTTPETPRCPPGMTPTAGKDGQPGNDECESPKTTTPAPPAAPAAAPEATGTPVSPLQTNTPTAPSVPAKQKPKVTVTKTTDSTGKPIIVRKNTSTGKVQIKRPGGHYVQAQMGSG